MPQNYGPPTPSTTIPAFQSLLQLAPAQFTAAPPTTLDPQTGRDLLSAYTTNEPTARLVAQSQGMPGFTAPYTRLGDQRSMPGFTVQRTPQEALNASMAAYNDRAKPSADYAPNWNNPKLTTGVPNSPGPKSPEAAATIRGYQQRQASGSKATKSTARGPVTQEGIDLALKQLGDMTGPAPMLQVADDRRRENEWISNLVAASNLSPANARQLESQYRSGLTQVPQNPEGSHVGDPLNPERDKVLNPLQTQIATLARINAGKDGGASAGSSSSNGGQMSAEQQMQMMKLVQDYMAPALMTAPESQKVATRQMVSAIPAYAALQNQAKVLLAQQSGAGSTFEDPYASASYINNGNQASLGG